MADSFYTNHWNSVRRKGVDARVQGLVTVHLVRERIQVSAPYNERFVEHAHALGGYWRSRSMFWSFPIEQREKLYAAIREVYGPTAV